MALPPLSFKGDREIEAALTALAPEIRERVIPAALRSGGRVVVRQARALAPRETGALKKSIGLVLRVRRRGIKYVALGPRRGEQFTTSNPEGTGFRVPANYGHLVEFGHFAVKSIQGTSAVEVGFVPAQPFLRPALLGSRELVKAMLIASLARAQARFVNARARRAGAAAAGALLR